MGLRGRISPSISQPFRLAQRLAAAHSALNIMHDHDFIVGLGAICSLPSLPAPHLNDCSWFPTYTPLHQE